MTACHRQASGAIELYFYDELDALARIEVGNHLRSCAECRGALEELSVIRTALESRPAVDAPAEGNWSAFMQRLEERIAFDRQVGNVPQVDGDAVAFECRTPAPARATSSVRTKAIAYLAMAALVTLVTSGVAYVARSSTRSTPVPAPTPAAAAESTPASATPVALSAVSAPTADQLTVAAFAALSEQHFERSKLVVLGLANKDPQHVRQADWAYERGLASDLLSDTRVYRQAAEERGMKTLAGVMSDLELVLLQTSLAEAPDGDALEQIQRLIYKRDLVTKMDATKGL